MAERKLVYSVEQLDLLDDQEIVEGYWDGRENFPCGENRSDSYWHGWRNGMADGGHAKLDWAQGMLAHDYLASRRLEIAND